MEVEVTLNQFGVRGAGIIMTHFPGWHVRRQGAPVTIWLLLCSIIRLRGDWWVETCGPFSCDSSQFVCWAPFCCPYTVGFLDVQCV